MKLEKEKIQEMLIAVREAILQKRDSDGMWRGSLSSSAISTSVSIFALYETNKDKYSDEIEKGVEWLENTMKDDGSWGDSIESPANMTATLLAYTSLYAVGRVSEKTGIYLTSVFGELNDRSIVKGVLKYYGKDLTFSVPILCMCALSGVISNWESIPPFPFELATLPQRFFRFLNLPVVSYAIPALIAIGILQMRKKHGRNSVVSWLREPFVRISMKKLSSLQPKDGGFLEAAPLTAFVSMCLSAAGYREHIVTEKSAEFLVSTQRKDGSWPIDTDLAGWVTSLVGHAIGDELEDRIALAKIIKQNITKEKHPFTGAPEGGWGWTNLSGSVPDGDDTSGALVALHTLTHGEYSEEIGKGLMWLLQLQNNDGGMPTFCKGWGKLPFDRSSPDISAHAALAMGLWLPSLPEDIKRKCENSFNRLLTWLEKDSLTADKLFNGKSDDLRVDSGFYWTPLWFGDQDVKDEKSHVYGTATLMDYLNRIDNSRAHLLARKGIVFLVESQNDDGGWGGQKGAASKVTLTAKAISALSYYEDEATVKAIDNGLCFLYKRFKEGKLFDREPIGLYFARLWYSEEMYNLCYLLVALKRICK